MKQIPVQKTLKTFQFAFKKCAKGLVDFQKHYIKLSYLSSVKNLLRREALK